MNDNFAGLSLARLYEKQGYIDDALEIYRAIGANQDFDDADINMAISRLELQKQAAHAKESVKEPDAVVLNSDSVQVRTEEAGMAQMIEVWLRLIVMRKRVDIFKAIKSRL